MNEESIKQLFSLSLEESKENHILKISSLLVNFFPSEEDAKRFVKMCEEHEEVGVKRILHQIYRLISFSDEIDGFETGSTKDGIKVFFWILCIEAIRKASTELLEEQKKEVIESFFENHIKQEHQQKLLDSIVKITDDGVVSLTKIQDVAHVFYSQRNVFAHEGIYWMFQFSHSDGTPGTAIIPKARTSKMSSYTMGNDNREVYFINIQATEVREIILNGTISFLKQYINNLGQH